MSSVKTVIGTVLLAATESVYNAGAVITGSRHTVQFFGDEQPTATIQYVFDGNREGANRSGGQAKRVAPSGRFVTGEVNIEGKGLGSAYSANALVPNMHSLLLASDLSASLNAGAWVFRPRPIDATRNSVAMAFYARQELIPVSGAYASFTMTADSAAPTMFKFAFQGIPGSVTDVSTPPAVTWIASNVDAPKNEAINLTIGAYAGAVVRSYSFEYGLEIFPRVNVNAPTGHAGFGTGRRKPVFKVTIETPAKSTFDPDAEFQNATARAIALTVGSVANNTIAMNIPQAVLTGVTRGVDGKAATVELTYEPYVSTPEAIDDFTLTFS